MHISSFVILTKSFERIREPFDKIVRTDRRLVWTNRLIVRTNWLGFFYYQNGTWLFMHGLTNTMVYNEEHIHFM